MRTASHQRAPTESRILSPRLPRVLLVLIILSICLSPRVRLEITSDFGDLRVQDFLLIVALVVCAIPSRTPSHGVLGKATGLLPILFTALGLLSLAWHASVEPTFSLLRMLAYLGRPIELFLLAAVIGILYVRSGERALPSVLRALHMAALANGAWMLYQYATGTQATLLGNDVGSQAAAYGPMLVGEGSAFGTGQFWVFMAALSVAERRAKLAPTWLTFGLLTFSGVAAVLADSRISVGVILVLAILYFGLAKEGRLRLNPIAATLLLLLGVAGLLLLIPLLGGRESPESILFSLLFRAENIWNGVFELIGTHFWLGVGPGALFVHLGQTEAHNVVLRAFVEFGALAGGTFIVIFVLVLIRAVRRANNHGDDQELIFGSYLALLAVGSILVSGMVQDALTSVTSSHLTMIAVGLFAAVSYRHDQRQTSAVASRSGMRLKPEARALRYRAVKP